MSDDFGGTPATAGLLTVGVALQGSFEVGYDVDLFKVSLSAGTTYLLGLSQLNMPYLGVRYSPMALLLKSDDGTLLDLLSMPETFQLSADTLLPVLQFTPAANGDYYLMARSDTAATGSYVLGASIQPPDDFRSDIATTGTLTPGAASHAVFEFAGDHDWFKFHAELGQHYNFSYSMAQPDSVAPSQFRLYDSAGKALPDSIYAFEPLTSGDYFLSAEGLQTGAYAVTEKLLQDDYSSNGSSPGQLTLNGSSSGALTYQGDQDRFLFAAAAGVTYAIELAGDPQDQPFLSFACYDSNGQYVQLATYTTASGALHASLTSTTATTYHILVSGRGYTGGLITHAPYSLSATGPSADDYGDTAATAAALSIGTTVHGALQSSRDVDMFQTQLQAGTTYRFVLEPDDGRVPGIATRQLQFSDADGQPLPGSFSAVPGQLEFTPSASGKVLISASASGLANTAAGYTLLSGLAADDVGANAAHAGVLPIGTKASGNLENGADRDWFAVNLTAGSTYWFQLEGVADNGGTLPQRATLRLVDAQGMEYASVHEIGTAAQQPLAFAPAVSGSYYVEVVYPGATGTYQLSAQIGLQDDYADDRAHATLLSLDSGITGSLELPNDKDLFQLMVTAGTTYNLRLDRASDHGYWQGPRPQLSDASGQPIALSSKLSGDTNFSFTAPSNGPVYVTVGIGVTTSSNIGPYYLQASSLGVDDFPANSSTTAVLLPNGKLQGTLNTTSDSDWIKVHLEAGQDYHFDLLGSANGGGIAQLGPLTLTARRGGTAGASGEASFSSSNQVDLSNLSISSESRAALGVEAHASATVGTSTQLFGATLSQDATVGFDARARAAADRSLQADSQGIAFRQNASADATVSASVSNQTSLEGSMGSLTSNSALVAKASAEAEANSRFVSTPDTLAMGFNLKAKAGATVGAEETFSGKTANGSSFSLFGNADVGASAGGNLGVGMERTPGQTSLDAQLGGKLLAGFDLNAQATIKDRDAALLATSPLQASASTYKAAGQATTWAHGHTSAARQSLAANQSVLDTASSIDTKNPIANAMLDVASTSNRLLGHVATGADHVTGIAGPALTSTGENVQAMTDFATNAVEQQIGRTANSVVSTVNEGYQTAHAGAQVVKDNAVPIIVNSLIPGWGVGRMIGERLSR
ncbi:MAG: hypothetical protein ACEQSK_16030 [Sphingomonadaceae bacterium]